MKVYALVITYRNCESLKKCLGRLLMQSGYLDKIVVVNNASNDNTEAYLELMREKVEVLQLSSNTGGAGGYHHGLKYCVEQGADWVWCVEDDILSSRNFARRLKGLLSTNPQFSEKVGFLYPKVISILNRNKRDGNVYKAKPEQQYAGLPMLEKAQFAGCILNARAIKRAGLPIKEFFIYYDDWEFTSRLIDKGYFGLFLAGFFVWHNSEEVRMNRPYLNRSKQEIWKNLYGIRNELYILRKHNKRGFIRRFIYNLISVPLIIVFQRKEDKLYVAFNWFKWTIMSLFFNAEVQYPENN